RVAGISAERDVAEASAVERRLGGGPIQAEARDVILDPAERALEDQAGGREIEPARSRIDEDVAPARIRRDLGGCAQGIVLGVSRYERGHRRVGLCEGGLLVPEGRIDDTRLRYLHVVEERRGRVAPEAPIGAERRHPLVVRRAPGTTPSK